VRRAPFVASCLAFALLAGACNGSQGGGGADDSALSKAADARVQIERLIRENVFLTAFMTEAVAGKRTKEYTGAASALDDNAVEMATLLRDQYGEDAEREYLTVLRPYQQVLAGYTARLVNKKKVGPAAKRLAIFPGQYGELMSRITPLLSPFRATNQMANVLKGVQSVIAYQAKKDFTKAGSALRATSARAGTLGTEVATAIIEDHPALFSGNPLSASAKFRYALSGLLEENVYLLTLATQDTVTRHAAESKGAVAALKASTAALAAQFASVYGGSFGGSFTRLWQRQSDLLLAYASAGKDKKKRDNASAELTQLVTEMTQFLVGANPELAPSELQNLFGTLSSGLRAVVDAQVAGDFDRAGIAIRSAAQTIDPLGATLTQGTVVKFPSKFRPPTTPASSPPATSPKATARTSGG
jgi:hypothetical protein